MASKYDRWLRLEEKRAGEHIEFTGEQVAFIEKQNPAFRGRHVESSRPGDLFCQHILCRSPQGVGRVYLHVVVDTFTSYAFGFLNTTKLPEAAVAMLHNNTLPFYSERKIPVSAILTGNSREFCGAPSHPYEMYLELNEIEHRRTKV